MNQYFRNLLELISHNINVLTGGDPDSCLCNRLYKYHYNGWLRRAIDWVFGEGHCKRAAENEGRDDSVVH